MLMFLIGGDRDDKLGLEMTSYRVNVSLFILIYVMLARGRHRSLICYAYDPGYWVDRVG